MDEVFLTVINVQSPEDIPCSELGCYISLKSTFIDIVTPIVNQINRHSLSYIQPESNEDKLSFIVKVMGEESRSLGTALVPIDVFLNPSGEVAQNGKYLEKWIPLCGDYPSETELIDEQCPMICVAFCVQQGNLNDSYFTSPCISSRYGGNQDSEEYILLAQELNDLKLTNEELQAKNDTLVQKNQTLEQSLTQKTQDLSDSNAENDALLEAQTNLDEEFARKTESYNAYIEDLKSMLARKDDEISALKQKLSATKENLETSQANFAEAESNYEASIILIKSKAEQFTAKRRRLEGQREDLSSKAKTLQRRVKKLEKEGKQKDEEIQKLTGENAVLAVKNVSVDRNPGRGPSPSMHL